MDTNLIAEAFKFMILGMTTVFVFLIVMVYILKIQAKIVAKYFPAKNKIQTKQNVSQKVTTATDDVSIVVAITAAIAEFKKKN